MNHQDRNVINATVSIPGYWYSEDNSRWLIKPRGIERDGEYYHINQLKVVEKGRYSLIMKQAHKFETDEQDADFIAAWYQAMKTIGTGVDYDIFRESLRVALEVKLYHWRYTVMESILAPRSDDDPFSDWSDRDKRPKHDLIRRAVFSLVDAPEITEKKEATH